MYCCSGSTSAVFQIHSSTAGTPLRLTEDSPPTTSIQPTVSCGQCPVTTDEELEDDQHKLHGNYKKHQQGRQDKSLKQAGTQATSNNRPDRPASEECLVMSRGYLDAKFDTASSDLPLPDSSAAWPQQPTPLHPPPPPDSLPHSCDSPLHTPSPPPPVTSTVNFSADQRVPVMWKTSCIVPVPKTPRPSDIKDYRPVALTSHIMKTMERLVLEQLRPMVQPLLDPLQFAYQPRLGVEDAIIYLLNRVYAHLDKPASTVRVMFFDFSSAFNTIQPALLGDKLNVMQVDAPLVSWIVDYLTGRPQYVRLHHCVSDRVVSNTGAPQGTVLSPFLFTLYTTDFNYCTETCHLQKFSDDSAVVGCISRGDEDEYRATVNDFVAWCELNHLQLNVTKTKELVVDLRRDKAQVTPISIKGVSVDTVEDYKYLGVHIDNKLDWSKNTDALYRKGQSRLYFLRRLRSFNICRTMLRIFYESVVASAILYAVACWGSRLRVADANRLNKLIRKASDVVGVELDSLMAVSERRTLAKLQTIMDNGSHPLYHTVMSHRSTFSARLIQPKCTTERHRRCASKTCTNNLSSFDL
ncbi:hypothetical protein NFI96_003892 [Prochilodus magdalenae]|nr:hypothetical protein NFI96_003892 [Prochilodus magdalenae]